PHVRNWLSDRDCYRSRRGAAIPRRVPNLQLELETALPRPRDACSRINLLLLGFLGLIPLLGNFDDSILHRKNSRGAKMKHVIIAVSVLIAGASTAYSQRKYADPIPQPHKFPDPCDNPTVIGNDEAIANVDVDCSGYAVDSNCLRRNHHMESRWRNTPGDNLRTIDEIRRRESTARFFLPWAWRRHTELPVHGHTSDVAGGNCRLLSGFAEPRWSFGLAGGKGRLQRPRSQTCRCCARLVARKVQGRRHANLRNRFFKWGQFHLL